MPELDLEQAQHCPDAALGSSDAVLDSTDSTVLKSLLAGLKNIVVFLVLSVACLVRQPGFPVV